MRLVGRCGTDGLGEEGVCVGLGADGWDGTTKQKEKDSQS